ncbi:MAG TPA: TonB-dependent receptor [Woeseiaceae bacterium]|nr:TonB-dependent receptor [Woeseiaceae bacterium]
MSLRIACVAAALPCAIALTLPAAAAGSALGDHGSVDRIVVVGTQPDIETARREAASIPGGVELVDLEAFRDRSVSSLADVLRYVPGVWATSDSGSDAMFFSSRGSNLDATDYDMNGIKLLEDGLPVTTADGNNHNRVVDPLNAHHVTFARGANALEHGASTLGGAANFVLLTARHADPLALSVDAGSFGQARARVTAAKVADSGLDGLVTLEHRRWDGYRDHSAQRRTGVYGNLGWQLSENVATRFYGAWIDNDQELPGALSRAEIAADRDRASAAAVRGDYRLDVATWRFANRTSWQIDGSRSLDFGFSFEEQSLFHPIVDRIFVDFDGPGPAEPVEVFSLLVDTDQRNAAAMLRYRHHVGAHELTLGANYVKTGLEGGHYRNLGGRHNGLTTRIDNDATLLEAFVTDHWALGDRFTLVLAAQLASAGRDVRNLDAATGALRHLAGDYESFNPRLGLLYDIGEDATLYANVSRLFEPPTNYELEDNVAGGDATLAAMKGTVVEIGTRGTLEPGIAGSWSWDLSLYWARIENEILSIDDPAAPGTSLSTNVDDTVHAGLEAVVRGRVPLGSAPDRFLEPLLSLTINRFRFEGDPHYGDNTLPAAPEYALRGEILYRGARGFYAGPTFELVGDRWADFANGYRIDGHALAGLRGGWSGERWSFWLEVRNLFDERWIASHDVRDIAATDAAILYPGEPRSVYAGLRRRWD